MGINRYIAIISSIIPSKQSFKELFEMLRSSFKRCWIYKNFICIDETIIPYSPRFDTKNHFKSINDEIPTVYFPRKPSPNGMLIYKMVTRSRTTGLEYVIDI